MASAFASFVSALLPDVVVLDPSDPTLKRLAIPVLRREIEEASPTSRLAVEAGEGLLAAGFHQQVPVRPGFLNLFLDADGERRALRIEGDALEIRGLSRSLPRAEALSLLETRPELWSPGVLLRPLVQDSLLPTAAYVGGPAEIAYNAQITPSYAHFGLPRPVLVPRPSFTLVEATHARALEAEALTIADLSDNLEAVLARWARESSPEVEAAFASARDAVTAALGRVEEAVGSVDPTLRGAAESACGRALHQLEGLHEKALRALKRRDQTRTERLRRTRDALFPGGALQERGLAFVSVLGRRGTALLDELETSIDPWTPGHQAVRL
jgi:bacillithiol biosynthesis cysteine-adding enzyme BshC